VFKPLQDKVIQRLESIVGKEYLLLKEEEKEPYSHDETPGLRALPEAVVKVKEEIQIQEILKLAQQEKFPLTPRGGGTGLSGGCVPILGGVVLSLERMNKILDIDRKNMMAVVEAGVINGVLQREVEKVNLFYPVNPASMDSCTLGGNVAEGTGGANTVRYGTTRNYVTGLRVILPSGEVLEVGGKVIKNSTDQNLLHLFIGSEGILGIVTQIIFRLLPKPSSTLVLIFPLKKLEMAGEISLYLFQLGITPTMVEVMDRKTLKFVEEYRQTTLPYRECEAHLLIRLDGDNPEELEKIGVKIGETFMEEVEDILVLKDPPSQRRIWELRQSIHDALLHKGKMFADEDVVVPRTRLKELFAGIQNLAEETGFPIAIFGHLGDGNIHVNFLRGEVSEETAYQRLPLLLEKLFSLTVSLGGKISGEHGIGVIKKPFLKKSTHPQYLSVLKGIKNQLDPYSILNPGKLIPE